MSDYFKEEYFEDLLERKHKEIVDRLVVHILFRVSPDPAPLKFSDMFAGEEYFCEKIKCELGCERHGLLINCDGALELSRLDDKHFPADISQTFDVLRKKPVLIFSKKKLKDALADMDHGKNVKNACEVLATHFMPFVEQRLTLDGLKKAAESNVDHCKYCKLSYDDIYDLWQTGQFTFSMNKPGPTLDRIDPDREYSDDNIAFCCMSCNLMKGDAFCEEDFMKVAKVVAKIKKRNLKYYTDAMDKHYRREQRRREKKERKMYAEEFPFDPWADLFRNDD